MYRKTAIAKNNIKITGTTYIGETIENKIRRIVNNKEPISDGAPLIYTDRKDGVAGAHDIRTDRFEVAVDAMDYVTRSHIAKREERMAKVIEMENKEKKPEGGDGGAESAQGTDKKP